MSLRENTANFMALKIVPISRIKIGKRFRKDLGDIHEFANNMKEIGLLQPIVVTPKLELVLGQRRIAAYRELGLNEIPAIISKLENLTLAEYWENTERKQFTFEEEMRIADALEPVLKRVAERRINSGKKDSEPLAQFPRGRVADVLAKNFNESRKTFERKRQIWKTDNPRRDELIEELNKGKSVNSAFFKLGIFERRQKLEDAIKRQQKNEIPASIRIGDAKQLLKQVPAKSVDCTVTSPPFTLDDDIDYMEWFAQILTEIKRVTIDYAFIFNSSTRMNELCRKTNPFRTLIWYKGITQETFRYEPIFIYRMDSARFNINSRIQRDVFPYSPPQPGERLHRDQNPPELYEELIQIAASETILDPFLGSGTTYKVCNELGKKCIGFEIERKYLPLILAA